MAEILFVTWDGGGNVPPALGIAGELSARGHAVRFVGHPRQRPSLEAAGVEVAPSPSRSRLLGPRRQLAARRSWRCSATVASAATCSTLSPTGRPTWSWSTACSSA